MCRILLKKSITVCFNKKKKLYLKANWGKFKEYLKHCDFDENLDADRLESKILLEINNAAQSAIPVKSKFNWRDRPLPTEIIELIKENRHKIDAHEEVKTLKDLSMSIKVEIQKHANKSWLEFVEKNPHPLSSVPFWQKIHKIRGEKNKNRKIAALKYKNRFAETDQEKAVIFKQTKTERKFFAKFKRKVWCKIPSWNQNSEWVPRKFQSYQ